MKFHVLGPVASSIALILFARTGAISAPTATPTPQDEGIVLGSTKEALRQFTKSDRVIRVTFPTPMVELDRVQRRGQPSPLLFDPVVELRWTWISQTEGKISFPEDFEDEPEGAAAIRNVLHRARLRRD